VDSTGGTPEWCGYWGSTRMSAVRRFELQADLTQFLGWAAARGVRLDGLRAAPAALDEVYHAVRNEKSDETGLVAV
jgi:hypothetical protein